MTMWSYQSNMNRGEIDPRLAGRIDTEMYYNGVETATNVLCIPQGGLKKRPGTKYIETGLANGRLINFSFNTEQNYLLEFTALKMRVYKDGVLQTNLNGSGNDFVVTPWSLAQLADLYYIQSADTAILVHEDVAPYKITRTGHTAWSVSAITFHEVPQWDYNDASSPTPTSEIQTFEYKAVNPGDRYKIALNGLLTEEITFVNDSANSWSSDAQAVQLALTELANTGHEGITVEYVSGSQASNNLLMRVTFADDSAAPWEIIGFTAIYVQDTNFDATVLRTQTGVSRKEDAWSAGRGYPRTATFHEGRLYFGGTKSLPSTIFGSLVGAFYHFDVGRALDDQMVSATLDTDQVNEIRALVSTQKLQVYTSGANFYCPASPITPSNIAFKAAANLGTKSIKPVVLDNSVIYAQRTGRAINSFSMTNEYQPTETNNIAILAPHLVQQPVELAVSRGSSETDANYIYILNADGSLTIFNTLTAEGVEGFSSWSTSGDIESIAVVDDELYMLVKRSVNSVDTYFVEKASEDAYLDCYVEDTDGGDDIDVSHLDTETISVVADGSYMGDSAASSSVDIGRDAVTAYAGLFYAPTIKLMPLNIGLKNGPNASVPKRIVRAAVRLYQSNGVKVNDIPIADRTIGQNQFDSVTPITGIFYARPLGYSVEAYVTITQDTPMPMTVLSVGLEVKV